MSVGNLSLLENEYETVGGFEDTFDWKCKKQNPEHGIKYGVFETPT